MDIRIVPATFGVSVQFGQPLAGNATLTLLDLEGRTIQSTTVVKGNTMKELNLDGIDQGIYLIR